VRRPRRGQGRRDRRPKASTEPREGASRSTRIYQGLTVWLAFRSKTKSGRDKGKVEKLVGYARRNYLVPLPRAATFEKLNAQLEARCRRRFDDRLRGHDAAISKGSSSDPR
jgi:transposase